jgi:PAS domain S-box-containing protein
MQRWYSRLLPRSAKSLAWLGILIVFAICFLDLLGWVFNIPLLRSIELQWIPMKVTTAICLVLLTIELTFLRKNSTGPHKHRIVLQAPGIVVGLVGLLTIVLYAITTITGKEVSLGNTLSRDLFWAPATRMSLLTAVLLFVTGSVLTLLAAGSRRAANIAHAVMAPAIMASYLVPVTYLLGVQSLHESLNVPVALNTGVCFCALGVAVFCVRSDTWLMKVFTDDHAGGIMARRLLPGLLMIPLVIGWLRLYGERSGAFVSEVGVALVALTYTFCLLWLVWITARSVNKTDDRRRQAEETLRESEERFKAIASNTPDHILVQDSELRYMAVINPQLGLTEQDMIGKTDHAFLSQEDADKLTRIKKQVLETGAPVHVETSLISQKGEEQYFDGSYVPKRNEEGETDGLIGYFKNVTERKRMEEELRRSEQRWATTLASIGDAVIAADAEGRITFMNAVAEELTGWKLSEASLMPVAEVFKIINEQTRREVDSPVAIVLREGMIVGLANHTMLVRKDGTEIPIDDSGAPIKDGDGKTMGVVLVFRDITERKKADETITRNLERFRIISNTASQLLISKTPQRIVETLCQDVMKHLDCHAFFNYLVDDSRNCLRLNAYAGILEETARKIHFLEFGVAVCGCAARDACRIVAENIPTSSDIRTELVKSFGIKAYACHPLFLEGRVIGTLSFGTRSRLSFSEDELDLMKIVADQVATAMERVRMLEITELRAEELESRVQERTSQLSDAYEALQREVDERKKTEGHLRQAQKLEAIGTLAGGIAHDFNNILAGIIGFAEMVQEDVAPDSAEKKRLDLVLKGAHRGRDLVKQILSFSRHTEQDQKPVALNQIIEEGLKLLRPTLPSTIKITTTGLDNDDVIYADPVQIHQVLMNLCTNAAHAMREKGGVLEIEITRINCKEGDPPPCHDMKPGAYVALSVRDTGHGMKPDVLERIFDPFFTTKKQGEGTGLGLSVLHGIVRNHKGYIGVESEPGKGSVFYIYLPKLEEQTKIETKQDLTTASGKERILVVDDEAILVELNTQRLSRLGYEVYAKTSSVDALELFRKEPDRFDLVITDYTMPNITGMDLAREFMKIRSDILIILCTGHSESISPDTAKRAGIKEFLMKPIAKHDLAQAVRRVLDRKADKRGA